MNSLGRMPLKSLQHFLYLYSFIFGILAPLKAQQETGPTIASPPPWVDSLEPPTVKQAAPNSSAQAGSHYLLIDNQIDLESQTRYTRHAILIENVNGAESHGRQTFDYQPSYESLVFHHFHVIREGRASNRLDLSKVKELQREADLASLLYDETKTILVILDDLRPGDIIDYAFSVVGSNPVLQGRYASSFSLGYSVPVDHLRIRIRSPDRAYQAYASEGVPPSSLIQEEGGSVIETWEVEDPKVTPWEDGAPYWHEAYPTLRISEFQSWSEVVDWALPLYDEATAGQAELCQDPSLPPTYLDPSNPLEARARAAIEFVQDDIRYFGIETGPNSLQPHDARLALQQRFGDCKDKAALLVALLRGIGIQAWPTLADSEQIRHSDKGPASPFLFDHAVVLVELPDGEPLLVDATQSLQRGPLRQRFQPSYGWGLPIRPGTTSLQQLPSSSAESYSLEIREKFALRSLSGPLALKVDSIYSGGYADEQRRFHKSNRPDDLARRFHEFYGHYYDGIEISQPPEIEDDEKNNIVRVIERYQIEEPWIYDQDKSRKVELVSPLIRGLLVFPSTKNRSMPLKLPHPYSIRKTLRCKMPRPWDIEPSSTTLDNPYFTLTRQVTVDGREIQIEFSYLSKTDAVSASGFPNYQDEANDAWDLLAYAITEDLTLPAPAPVTSHNSTMEAWLSLALATLAFHFAFPRSPAQASKTEPASTSLAAAASAFCCLGFLAYDAYFILIAERQAFLLLPDLQRFALLASLYERLFVGLWSLLLAKGRASPSRHYIMAKRLCLFHATFLTLWLVVRSGAEQPQLGFQLFLLAEILLAVAISLFALRKPRAHQTASA